MKNEPQQIHSVSKLISKTLYVARDSAAGLADYLLKPLENSKLLENLPIIDYSVKILNIKDAFQQLRLRRNLIEFLMAVREGDYEKIIDFTASLEDEPSRAEDFADTIISILIESTKPIKARIAAKLVNGAATGKLSYEELDCLLQIVQVAAVPALLALPSFMGHAQSRSTSHAFNIKEEPLLMSLGISSRFGTNFRISKLGTKLYELGFDNKGEL